MHPGGFEAFANRLDKNVRHLRKWAKREEVTCYRVYDRDLHDYNVAVDVYEQFVHVQEYERPPKIDDKKAQARLDEVVAHIPEALEVRPEDVYVKVRRRQRGGTQYEKLAEGGRFEEVTENGHTFLVNFTDYLDTGLFLDHRDTRAMIQDLAKGRTFLNLFAYTGSATVYAAKGGATSTTTVDMSNTYLDWAARNFERNGLAPDKHELVRADCLLWIPGGASERRTWDLIFLDPPTFSTSKKMDATFEVQRDHVTLINATAKLLSPDGVLIFSNNMRRFEMEHRALPGLHVKEITEKTIPLDFERNAHIHNAWMITRGMSRRAERA